MSPQAKQLVRENTDPFKMKAFDEYVKELNTTPLGNAGGGVSGGVKGFD